MRKLTFLRVAVLILFLVVVSGCAFIGDLLSSSESMFADASASSESAGSEINIYKDGFAYINGSATYDFSDTVIWTSMLETFTIENTGDADLYISSISSSDGSQFYIDTNFTDFIVASGFNTTIDIVFNSMFPAGSKLETITINSDDPDNGVFTFDVEGNTVPTPPPLPASMKVTVGSIEYFNNGTYDFDLVPTPMYTTFTIENVGGSPLYISSVFVMTGDFMLSIDNASLRTLNPFETATFDVEFFPMLPLVTSFGNVDITSDDPVNGMFKINLMGIGM